MKYQKITVVISCLQMPFYCLIKSPKIQSLLYHLWYRNVSILSTGLQLTLYSLSINLLNIFSVNHLVILLIKYQIIVRNAFDNNSPQLEVTSSNVLFCAANSPKPKDFQFTPTDNKENHKIIIFVGKKKWRKLSFHF